MHRISLLLIILVTMAPLPAIAEGIPQIGGDYNCTEGCKCEPRTNKPYVIQDDRHYNYRFINECGQAADGIYEGKSRWSIADWKTDVTVFKNGDGLEFSNATVWEKPRK